MKCSECGQILAADIIRCANCGTPVRAKLRFREVDEPVSFPEPEPEVIDLTELDVVDLRELVSQLSDEPVAEEHDKEPVAAVASPAIRQAWQTHAKNSALLWPQRSSGPRPTTDDITPRR
jgi:hypothetical protein